MSGRRWWPGAGRTGCDAELKRVETENAELKDRFARRQADFENYRRVERERETYNRVVADVAAKLLPVVDNLKQRWRPGRRSKPPDRTSFVIFSAAWISSTSNSMACSTASASSPLWPLVNS